MIELFQQLRVVGIVFYNYYNNIILKTKMNIITVTGSANEGKTSTINILIELICSKAQVYGWKIEKFTYGTLVVVKVPAFDLCIGFGKDGDSEQQVVENCRFAEDANVDVFVQTTRKRGRGVDYLWNFAKGTHDIIRIGTITRFFGLQTSFLKGESEIQEINKIQAQNIFRLLLHILRKKYCSITTRVAK